MSQDINAVDIQSFIKACDTAERQKDLLSSAILICKNIDILPWSYHYIPHRGSADYKKEKILYARRSDPAWEKEYLDYYKNQRDPVQTFCLKAGRAISTHELLVHEGFQSEENQKFLKKGISKIGHGVAVPVIGSNHSRGMFFLNLIPADKIPNKEQLFVLEQMCYYFHRRYCELSQIRKRQISLTKREMDVLQLLPLGRSNREIATVLSISHNTVNDYVKNLLLKLDAPDRITALLRAENLNLIE